MATKSTPAVSVVRKGKLVRDVTTGVATDGKKQTVMKRPITKVTGHVVDKPKKAKARKAKARKWEERVWYNTNACRFARMKRKERFVHSVKSVVDVLAQQGYVTIPEDLITSLYKLKMLTRREFERLISIKPTNPLKIAPVSSPSYSRRYPHRLLPHPSR